jgi:hypothetical protein
MSKTASECVRARGLSLKFACRCHGGCGSERLIPVVDIVTFVPRESMTSPSSGVYTVPVGRLPSASMWSPICVSGPRKIRYGSYRGATDGGKSRDRARQLPIASLTMLRLTIVFYQRIRITFIRSSRERLPSVDLVHNPCDIPL